MFNGKTHYKWSFSIAMLNYQRYFWTIFPSETPMIGDFPAARWLFDDNLESFSQTRSKSAVKLICPIKFHINIHIPIEYHILNHHLSGRIPLYPHQKSPSKITIKSCWVQSPCSSISIDHIHIYI